MADKKKTFPMLPIGHWWSLRKKFKQSIPGVVTNSYLATVLQMGIESARANVLPFLKTLGIIDAEGKTGERAKQWRDDARYAQVCKDILSEVYPAELLHAVTDPSHRQQAETWFANETGAGEAAVARMAVLYCVLLEGDASKQPDEKTDRPRPEKKVTKTREADRPVPPTPPKQIHTREENANVAIPGININLEIHISADSTPDQIDAIFAGMAKHIYRRG